MPTSRRSGGARTRASQRQAHIVPISTGMPISVIAVPKPKEIAVTRKLNSATPSGSASSRYRMRPYVRGSRIGRTVCRCVQARRAACAVDTGTRTMPDGARAARHSRRGCGPRAPAGAEAAPGTLDLRQSLDRSRGLYVEGSVSYVRVRTRGAGGRRTARRQAALPHDAAARARPLPGDQLPAALRRQLPAARPAEDRCARRGADSLGRPHRGAASGSAPAAAAR